jgi:lysophospholipase L1-like esterase
MALWPLLLLQTIILRNGDMEAGTTFPLNWENKWIGQGTVTATRDSSEKHGGTASLRLDSRADSKGQYSQFIEAKPGSKFTIEGWVKTSGAVKANLAFQPFSADWTKNEFNQIGYSANESGWQKFSQTVTVPDWSTRFAIGLTVEGEGKAWLDDVKLIGDSIGVEDKTVPPEVQDPTVPYRGYWPTVPDAWNQTFDGLKTEAAKGGKDVVFIGDSITQGWTGDNGKPIFEREFGPLKPINLGIGGDKTCQLLYRIDNGQFDGLDPKVVVLNIGVNNLWAGNLDPEKVADGVSAVIARIRAKLPKAKILNIGILPAMENLDHPTRVRANAVNTFLAKPADGKRVVYVDLAKSFVDGTGRLPKEVMPDFVHPNAKGYELYAAAVLPKIRELLNSK